MSNTAIFTAGLASIILDGSNLRLASVAVSDLKIDPLNVRSDLGTETELLQLGHSMLVKQETPLVIRSDGTVRSGHRRRASALMVGITHLDCIIDDSDDSTARKLAEVMHRSDISSYDKAVAIRKALDEKPGMTQKELADTVLHQDSAQVTRFLKIFKCDPLVIEAARLGQISVTDWDAISKKSPSEQLAALNRKLGIDPPPPSSPPAPSNKKSATVKVKRVKLPLATGDVVSLTGTGISLEDIAQRLEELSKKVKQAIAEGWDVKTFEKVMTDSAAN